MFVAKLAVLLYFGAIIFTPLKWLVIITQTLKWLVIIITQTLKWLVIINYIGDSQMIKSVIIIFLTPNKASRTE